MDQLSRLQIIPILIYKAVRAVSSFDLGDEVLPALDQPFTAALPCMVWKASGLQILFNLFLCHVAILVGPGPSTLRRCGGHHVGPRELLELILCLKDDSPEGAFRPLCLVGFTVSPAKNEALLRTFRYQDCLPVVKKRPTLVEEPRSARSPIVALRWIVFSILRPNH